VAGAIVAAACGPSPAPIGALGAAGWTLWRVDRLLDSPPPRAWEISVMLAVVTFAALVLGRVTVHAFHALSNWHAIPVLTICCVV
jgi:hypothetical protein